VPLGQNAQLHRLGIVAAQPPLDHSGEEAEAELTAAPALIGGMDWQGRVLTGDALYCDTDLCATLRRAVITS
jgi:hypothetical protein